MTLAFALLLIPLIAAFGGLLLAAADSVGPPPSHIARSNPRLPLRGLHPPDENQLTLEAAPHRGRLVAWGGSIWRSR